MKKLFVINGWFSLCILIAVILISGFISVEAFFMSTSSQSGYVFVDGSYVKESPHYFKGAVSAFIVLLGLISICGFCVLNPGEGLVATFAGKYKGELRTNGFWFINPLYSTEKLTLKLQNHEIKPITVNDKDGNPVIIGAVIVYNITDMYKATYEVEDYDEFNATQSEAALRRIAGKYEYNVGGDNDSEGLSSSNDAVRQKLIDEISSHVVKAGITISDANITHLTYAPEIAGAMLQKQQAKATLAARKTIVDGAISIVKDAVNQLSVQKIADFSEPDKARLASNLLVVICGEKAPVTTINLS